MRLDFNQTTADTLGPFQSTPELSLHRLRKSCMCVGLCGAAKYLINYGKKSWVKGSYMELFIIDK